MSGLISPLELLGKLFEYLSRGDSRRCVELFARNSSSNQLRTFLNIFRADQIKIHNVGEYVVVFTETRNHGKYIFVIGLDDNYRFFCHNLPEDSVGRLDPNNLSVEAIRREMGFEYHIWEVAEQGFMPRTRIRVQGDVVIGVEEVFENEDLLYAHLYKHVMFLLLRRRGLRPNISIVSELRRRLKIESLGTPEEVLEYLKEYVLELKGNDLARMLGLLRRISAVSPGIWSDKSDLNLLIDEMLRSIDKQVRRILEIIFDLEAILNLRLGNHIIKIIGVNEWDIIRITKSEEPPPRNFVRVYVLRPHRVLVLHDEHGATSFDIPRSVIRIQTLRTGPLQITRHQTTRSRAFLQMKITIVDLCDIDPIMIMPRGFITSWRNYLEILGVQPYVYSHEVDVNNKRILCRVNIWFIKPRLIPDVVYRTYLKGALLGAFIIDLTDRWAVDKLRRHMAYFWANTSYGNSIIVVGYKPKHGGRNYSRTVSKIKDLIDEFSQRLGISIVFIEIEHGKRKIFRDVLIDVIEKITRRQLEEVTIWNRTRKIGNVEAESNTPLS